MFKKGISKISILIIIAVIFIIFGIAMTIYTNIPSVKFKIGVKNLFNQATTNLNNQKYEKLLNSSKPLEMKNSISLKSSLKAIDNIDTDKLNNILNTTQLDFNIINDKNNKYSQLDLNLNAENTNVVNISAYADNEKTYILLKNLYDKYIEINSAYSDIIENKNTTNEEYSYIINKFSSLLSSNIKDSYITKSNEDVKIDNKTIKATKLSLSLYKMIDDGAFDNIINGIKNDKKSLDILIKILNNQQYGTEEQIKTMLDDTLKNIKDEKDSYKDINISIYINGILGNIIGYSYNDSTNNIKYFNTKSNGKDNITVNINDGFNINLIGLSNDTNINYDYSIIYKDQDSNEQTLKGNIKESFNLKNNNSGNGELDISLGSDSTGTLELTDFVSISTLDSVDKKDFSNNVSINNISYDDITKIISKLQANHVLNDISDVINGIYSDTEQYNFTSEAIYRSDIASTQSSISFYVSNSGGSGVNSLPILDVATLNINEINKCPSRLKDTVPTDTRITYYTIDYDKIANKVGVYSNLKEKSFIMDSNGKVYYNGNPDNY